MKLFKSRRLGVIAAGSSYIEHSVISNDIKLAHFALWCTGYVHWTHDHKVVGSSPDSSSLC